MAHARQQFELYLAMASQWKTQLDAMVDDWSGPATAGSSSVVPPVKSPTSPADAPPTDAPSHVAQAKPGHKKKTCAAPASLINPKEEIDDASPTPPLTTSPISVKTSAKSAKSITNCQDRSVRRAAS